jgi:tRNA(fMet)-specific endonuclease VapC
MFAFDSNAVIHALKGIGGVGERIAGVNPSNLAIPAVVAYELEVGTLRAARPEQRRRDLQRFFGAITILPFDGQAADCAAQLRVNLEKLGAQIGPLDTLIAGTVIAHGAILITHNTTEFSRIPGIRIEDWF